MVARSLSGYLASMVFFGSPQIVEKARREFKLELLPIHIVKNKGDIRDGKLNIVEIGVTHNDVEPGVPTEMSGMAAVKALELATAALEDGDIQVLVTAPISKKAVQSEEFRFPGHTEYLQQRPKNTDRTQEYPPSWHPRAPE